jgi:hypothetical protein
MAITNGYATLAEVKSALQITDSYDDAKLELAIESASRLIDGHAQRVFYNAGTATRYYVADSSWTVPIDDLQSVTTLTTSTAANGVYDVTWSSGDYQLEPLNGYSGGLTTPYTRIRAVGDYSFPMSGGETTVKLIGVFGWAAVPTTIKQAAIIQASRIFKRLDSPLGVAGFGDLGVVRVSSRLDPDVAQLVEPYRLMRYLA